MLEAKLVVGDMVFSIGSEFVYITDLPIRNKNIKETISLGRKRWKIENEGFKMQKHGTFDIGHLYSKNQTAIKVHYLMIQIAHILRQLVENGVTEIVCKISRSPNITKNKRMSSIY